MRLVTSSDEWVQLAVADKNNICLCDLWAEIPRALGPCFFTLIVAISVGLLWNDAFGVYIASIGILSLVSKGLWLTFWTRRHWRVLFDQDRVFVRLVRDLRPKAQRDTELLKNDVVEIDHSELASLGTWDVEVRWSSFLWEGAGRNHRAYLVLKPNAGCKSSSSILTEIAATQALGCQGSLFSLAGAKDGLIYLDCNKVRPTLKVLLTKMGVRQSSFLIGPIEERLIDMRLFRSMSETDQAGVVDLLYQLNFGAACQSFLALKRPNPRNAGQMR